MMLIRLDLHARYHSAEYSLYLKWEGVTSSVI